MRGLVDGIAETLVVWRTLDQLVDERTGIANERSGVPAGTKQLALVAALGQRSDDPLTARLGMASVLLQHQGQVLADEFRTRNLALASGAGAQPIVVWIQRDRGGFLPR